MRTALCRAAAASLLLALAAGAGLVGCASSPAASPTSGPVREPERGATAEEFLMSSLGRAVEAHEDEVARRLLARLRTQGLTGRSREVADAYERILVGRALVGTLDLHLEARPEGPDANAARRVVLVASTRAGRPLELRTGPATLEVERRTIDRLGHERLDRQTTSFDTLSELELPAAGAIEVELAITDGTFRPGALAERQRWRILMRAGEIEDEGRSYPAMHVRVTAAEEQRVTPDLDGRTVSPEELGNEAAGGRLGEGRALELAVQVPRERHEEALDVLAAVVEDLPLSAVSRLTPALRWLAPEADAGSDPNVWRGWLRVRTRRPEGRIPPGRGAPDDLDDRLDLPVPKRP